MDDDGEAEEIFDGRGLDQDEEHLLRQSVQIYVGSTLYSVAMYFSVAFQPFFDELRHLRLAAFLIGVFAGMCTMMMGFALWSERAELESRVRHAENMCLVVRLLMHVVCIAFDGDASFVFLKLVSLWIHPLSAAKETRSALSFKVYLAIHNAMVIARFRDDWRGGVPWIVCTLVLDRTLLDWHVIKQESRRSKRELAVAHESLEQAAEVTTKELFERFCDATATLDADLSISEPATQLAAMLGKQGDMMGRAFGSLMDGEDLKTFSDHMELVKQDLEENAADPAHTESVQVRLLDAWGKPVSVHVFHAGFRSRDKKPVYFLGISEAWRPPRSKSKAADAHRQRLGTVHSVSCGSLLFEGGRGAPSTPLGSSLPPALAFGRLEASGARRRQYSPRPTRSMSLPR